MKASEVLRGAKGVLQRQGWLQGGYGTVDGPVDLLGACAVACGAKHLGAGSAALDAEQIVVPYLREVIGLHVSPWNDTFGRTLDEVIAAIDRAIALAEADEATKAVVS